MTLRQAQGHTENNRSMTNKKDQKKFNPFKNLVFDDYEKEIEKSLESGKWKRTGNFSHRKKEMEISARRALDLRKTKRVTFRISQYDLIRLKTRAQKKSIPYQTLLTALIRDYIEGHYLVKL